MTDRLLGRGTFGRVFLAIEQRSRTQLACKVVDLRQVGTSRKRKRIFEPLRAVSSTDPKQELVAVQMWADRKKRQIPFQKLLGIYFREFEILSSLNHPNIIGIDKFFVTDNTLYIFEDLMSAGNLLSYVKSKGDKLLEDETAFIVRQVIKAIQYLHERNTAHGQLKAENIMLTSRSFGVRVVLTNFGCAKRFLDMQRMPVPISVQEYETHQKLNRSSGFSSLNLSRDCQFSSDVWSIGAITAFLLVGSQAVNAVLGTYNSTLGSNECFSRLEDFGSWQSLHEKPKHFVHCVLASDGQYRFKANHALNHPWISSNAYNTDFESLYQQTIKNWQPRNRNVPLIEFVDGRSAAVKHFNCSQGVLEGNQIPTQSSTRSLHIPVDPPYKPYYRKVQDQASPRAKPKKRSPSQMAKDVKRANEEWRKQAQQEENLPPVVEKEPFKKPQLLNAMGLGPQTQRVPRAKITQVWHISKTMAPPPLVRTQSFRQSVNSLMELEEKFQGLDTERAGVFNHVLRVRRSLPKRCGLENMALLKPVEQGKVVPSMLARGGTNIHVRTSPSSDFGAVRQAWSTNISSVSKLSQRSSSTSIPRLVPSWRGSTKYMFDLNCAEWTPKSELQDDFIKAQSALPQETHEYSAVVPHATHLRITLDDRNDI